MPALDPITLAAQAIEARLRTYFPTPTRAGGWHLDHTPEPMSLDEFKSYVARTPWLGLGWRDLAASAASGRTLSGNLRFTLRVVVKNQDRQARLFGDRLGPGLYPSVITAAGLLQGLTIREVGTVRVALAASAYAEGWADQHSAIGALDLAINTELVDVTGAGEAAPEFTRLISRFDVGSPTTVEDTIEPREAA